MTVEKGHVQHANTKATVVVRTVMTVLFVLYLMLLIYLTLLSGYFGRRRFFRSFNLVSFRTIINYLRIDFGKRIIITNLLGNIAAFVPMGFVLPVVSSKYYRFSRVFIITAGTSLAIEVLQYTLAVGAADVDDLILNSIGGAVGYLLYRAVTMVLRCYSTKTSARME